MSKAKRDAGAVWVIGVSAPAVVTGIYQEDGISTLRSYRILKKNAFDYRAT